jgi:hypothetical protein
LTHLQHERNIEQRSIVARYLLGIFLAGGPVPNAPTPPIPTAEFRVLLALLDGKKHGHAIKLDIRQRTAGRVDMGPGTLYGAIKRLVGRAWIEATGASAGGRCR